MLLFAPRLESGQWSSRLKKQNVPFLAPHIGVWAEANNFFTDSRTRRMMVNMPKAVPNGMKMQPIPAATRQNL